MATAICFLSIAEARAACIFMMNDKNNEDKKNLTCESDRKTNQIDINITKRATFSERTAKVSGKSWGKLSLGQPTSFGF